jgi:hypothetical protein
MVGWSRTKLKCLKMKNYTCSDDREETMLADKRPETSHAHLGTAQKSYDGNTLVVRDLNV